MKPPARDVLKVVMEGEEVPGLVFYGLRSRGEAHRRLDFPSTAWVGAPTPAESVLQGAEWELRIWDVPILVWPTARGMQESVRTTLAALVEAGARVAWVGSEGSPFADPPALFDPEWMSGGVLAWLTDAGMFSCPLRPDEPLAPVSDDELLRLREHARGLADSA